MTFQNRFVRLTAALGVAGLVAMQIPMRSGTALAQNACGDGGSKIFGVKTETLVAIGAGGAILYGLLAAGRDSKAGSLPSGNSSTKTLYDLLSLNPTEGAPVADESVVAEESNLGEFSELRKLIDAAGLGKTLREDGPFTVFAPTNAALAKLPAEVVGSLGKPENKEKLARLLKAHIIQGRYRIEDLKGMGDGKELLTLSGDTITITNTGGLKANGVAVSESDIAGSNGWIHPIEAALPAPQF
jgi:uncharacterized surface protein with fasciclin (FAS1) repeats